MRVLVVFLLIQICSSFFFAQEKRSEFGTIIKYQMMNAPFPHKEREKGHSYKETFYDSENHYSDSTVLVFIPDYFQLKDSVDYVFYFHGWNNCIDTSLIRFNLIEQFYSTDKNSIFVFPEGPKNSPDSFGGKLEEKGIFKEFIDELNNNLSKHFNSEIKSGNITLSGHSGAYRVIAYILMHGGLAKKINSVILFDALYADTEKFTFWLDNFNGRFINIYTENGGTKSESENLMRCLTAWEIPFLSIKSDKFTLGDLTKERIIFISSKLNHNEVIHTKNQFQKFLESNF